MTDLAKLVVRLEAQTAKYQSELEKANKRLDRFQKRSDGALRKLGRGAAAGAAVAGGAIAALTARMIDQGDQLDKLSIRLGVSVENLSRLQFAAERTGVSAQTMNTALQRMQRRISEVAKTGKGEALPALDGLGLSAERLAKLTPEQQFLALAESFKGVSDQGERVRLAMKLFDTEGVALLQTMDGGAAAVAALAAESDSLGNTISTNTAKQSAKLKDTMTNLQGAANGAAQELLRNLGPQIVSAAEALQNILPKAAQIASAAFYGLQGTLVGAAGFFQGFVGNARKGIGSLLETIGANELGAAFQRTGDDALGKANILFAQMEATFAKGMNGVNKTIELNAPALQSIIPNQADVQGKNITPTDQREADKFKAESERIVSLQRERFRRLHEEALQAEGRTQQLEQERYARELATLDAEEQRLRERFGKDLALEAEFQKAREDAKTAHEKRVTEIEEEQHKARDDLRKAQLQAAGDFFGTLGNLAKEGSKAQRVLFAAEKAAALARSIIAMQEAIAKANALGFPANIGAIASAAATGAQAIAAIQSTNIAGARASGGPVRGGLPYLVGERGPEVVVPSSSGNVVPNHMLGGNGAVKVEIHQLPGSPELQVRADRRNGELRLIIEEVTRQTFDQDMESGRGISQSLGRNYGLQRRVG